MVDVVCLGEALVDLISQDVGHSLSETQRFERYAGGAPANVAVGVARLGVTSGFVGKVGEDVFGDFLIQVLAANGVDVEWVVRTDLARTGLAFVNLSPEGEREFLFYRHPSADMLLQPEEVEPLEASMQESRIFHFGSLSLIHEPARLATLRALEIARSAGCQISFDPNLRIDQWSTASTARDRIRRVLAKVDVLKVSASELDFLVGNDGRDAFIEDLWHQGLRLLAVTLGACGCRFFSPGSQGTVPGFEVPVVDTTGAGDGFVAGLLFNLVRSPKMLEAADSLVSGLRYANAVAALTTTCRGAVSCSPTHGEVERFLEGFAQKERGVRAVE